MSAALLALISLAILALGYYGYGGFLARRIFDSEASAEADSAEPTPAHRLRDDVDYIPCPKPVLFGHHFTSIAGAGPIVGPAVAVIWGWLPALAWILFGAIFIGATHDFGCLVASARNQGRSMADLTTRVVGPRARLLFLLMIVFLTWIVLAVFAFICASLFVDYPASVIPINFEIIVAIALGLAVTRYGVKLFWPSLAALVWLYILVFVGVGLPVTSHDWFLPSSTKMEIRAELELASKDPQLKIPDETRPKLLIKWLKDRRPELAEALSAARSKAVEAWMIALLIYSAIASALPVWLLLQPRDYINSHQLFVGLAGLYLGLIILNPPVTAPALRLSPPGAPPMLPFLFVIIACGAISGFHGLVSSGTSSKQLDQLKDARGVAYAAMLGEAALGLVVVLACIAGFPNAEAWQAHYAAWAAADGLDAKLDAFLKGGSVFLTGIGLPIEYGLAVIAVIVISFAATTLDSAARIQRFVLAELGSKGPKPIERALSHPWLGSIIACASPLLLLYARSNGKALWQSIWPVFGAANQLLGALSLAVLTLWLKRQNKPIWPVLIPLAIIGSLTLTAFGLDLWRSANTIWSSGARDGLLLGLVTALLFGFGLWVLLEAALAWKNPPEINNEAPATESPAQDQS